MLGYSFKMLLALQKVTGAQSVWYWNLLTRFVGDIMCCLHDGYINVVVEVCVECKKRYLYRLESC